jgi:hypothetical protein
MGDLKWPFWTKLVVVAIGFTGGLVFMYIQCKVQMMPEAGFSFRPGGRNVTPV